MQSTPVAIASAKLLKSSAIASASPIVVWLTPGGRLRRLGSSLAWRATSPSGCWFSSMSKLMLRSRS